MTRVRTFDVGDWTADRLLAAKRSRTISLCIPCRNEAETVGAIVATCRDALVDRVPVLDEVIVLDDRSTDDTAATAAAAGARVVPIEVVHAEHGSGNGKGNALWATLEISTGDLVVWCDGDVTTVTPDWIIKLVVPLLLDDTVAIVKPIYHRPTDQGGGGRTTELVARPLLALFEPDLAAIAQPLAGEYAIRRSVIERLAIVQGWGAEIGMLLDIAHTHGAEAIAQVELGERRHRHQSLTALAGQATEVLATALERIQRRQLDRTRQMLPSVPERPPVASRRSAEFRNLGTAHEMVLPRGQPTVPRRAIRMMPDTKHPSVDYDRLRAAVREILSAIGEDPDRDGLQDTPDRVARMYEEVLAGLHEDPRSHLTTTFEAEHDEIVLVLDIPFASTCEHHMVPFLGRAHLGYLPGPSGRITGLSKLARLVDGYARRLQVQERLTSQIAAAMEEILEPAGVIVVVEAEHLCMSIRGVSKPGTKTVTSAVRGHFRQDSRARAEAISLINAPRVR